MYASQFLSYLNDVRGVSAVTLRAVKAEAKRRLLERWAAGRADSPLTFTDLWERCEREVAPR